MKRPFFALCLVLLLVLSGCRGVENAVESATPEPTESHTVKPTLSPEPTPSPEPTHEPTPSPETTPEIPQESTELLYNTWVTDSKLTHIIRTTLDPQGYDLSVYFEIPYFHMEFGDYGDTEKLNQFFRDLRDEFFSPSNADLLRIWECAQTRPRLSWQWDAQVSFRSKELVSVILREYWMAGGVICFGSKSYTFRTDTAELLTLADVAEGTEEELKTAILTAIEAAAEERLYDTEKVLAAAEKYALEDFKFHVCPDGIEIEFDSYELGRSSAESNFSIKPDITVKSEWLD